MNQKSRHTMNKVLVALILCFLAIPISYSGPGVSFVNSDYAQVINTAKSQNKLILLDFTAPWCHPCKRMDRETFTDEILSKYVNDHFIPYKVDVKYFDAMDIADKFKVKSYPTILVLNPYEKEVKRLLGFQTADGLLAQLQNIRK